MLIIDSQESERLLWCKRFVRRRKSVVKTSESHMLSIMSRFIGSSECLRFMIRNPSMEKNFSNEIIGSLSLDETSTFAETAIRLQFAVQEYKIKRSW